MSRVTAYRPFYIIGAVNRPGEYPYVANMTALNAVAFGGGFTDQARQSTVFVRHEGSTHEDEVPANQITRIYPGRCGSGEEHRILGRDGACSRRWPVPAAVGRGRAAALH